MLKLVIFLPIFVAMVLAQNLPKMPIPNPMPMPNPMPIPMPGSRVVRQALPDSNFPLPGAPDMTNMQKNFPFEDMPKSIDPRDWIQSGSKVASKIAQDFSGRKRRRNV